MLPMPQDGLILALSCPADGLKATVAHRSPRSQPVGRAAAPGHDPVGKRRSRKYSPISATRGREAKNQCSGPRMGVPAPTRNIRITLRDAGIVPRPRHAVLYSCRSSRPLAGFSPVACGLVALKGGIAERGGAIVAAIRASSGPRPAISHHTGGQYRLHPAR